MSNLENVMNKLILIDRALDALSRVHKDDGDKADELVKKFSTRKLILVEEAYKLISPLS